MHTFRPHADVTVLNDQTAIPGLGHLPINAFVLHAEQPVVVDTGLGLPDRDFVAGLGEIMDPQDVRWIWLTHPDRDHTGGVFSLLDAAPQARLVTTFAGVGVMATERPLPLDRVYLLNPGQQLDVGDRMLAGFRPALFDSPATVGVRDLSTGVCFTSDCFGSPLPSAADAGAEELSDVDATAVRDGQLLWASVDSPWVQWVDRARFAASLDEMRAFDASWTFSVHLPPVRGRSDALLQTLSRAPEVPNFVGPDQAALEAMLASFEPAPVG